MSEIFEQLSHISFRSIDEQIIEMLRGTWPKISMAICESAIGRTYDEGMAPSLWATPDIARTAVYSHINIWHGTMKNRVLDEWMDLTPNQQNALLIRAFPDGRTYDV